MDDSLSFFMEVECIGNTQIIHMEETGITQRTIGFLFIVFSWTLEIFLTHFEVLH